MTASSYDLADEPSPSNLGELTVRPWFCMLALVLGGAWLAWPWYALNAVALGSPTRDKELKIVAGTLAVTGAVSVAIVLAYNAELLPLNMLRYALIVLTVAKLAAAYSLNTLQRRTFHIYEYYGGIARNGMPVVMVGMILRPIVLELVAETPILFLMFT
ncbi:MAG: hypothetical protein ACJAYU_003619 [Bradymonadia bacterium]|jgi:hypothetical protein